MSNGKPVDGSVYIYAPNKIAPVFFVVAFATSGLFHLWQCFHYRCFKVTSYHWICCLFFVVGFITREYGAFNYENLPVYIASQTFIYMSPPLLELANYHVLGRLLYYIPYFAPLHPGRVLTTFGSLSTLVEVTNAIGISYIANTSLPENLTKLGHILMKTSLILQLIVIALFVVLATMTHRRCLKARYGSRGVEDLLLTLYVSTGIIFIRTIYRTVEHFAFLDIRTGPTFDPAKLSPILRYEWLFYVFEASVMLVNEVWWNMRHPRRYLPQDYRVYLAQDGQTEIQGPGWDDERSWAMTFFDPFGMMGKGKGKDKEKRKEFWEINGFDNGQSGMEV
ncbi:uncharacterized protein BDR25DRAFT_334542 [Lindgomyces ingoldianus]|uniref:Uncharacterized protein n=1 Tax=Lindgomyces ingoldianus TaxID=673940 RepID=A0ACB6QTW5_9PLEO|nr:uncharacterized protein BDR25DRAFT_334542 [Lindgomyces ingoldianus]KAF2470018.1 hypothetical protein BDR25DRAFT_334542 [Lindgomyces ingoldianus]